MTEKQTLVLAEKLRKQLLRDFGKTRCREMMVGCASCQGHILLGYLNWYIDLLEFPSKPKKKK